MIILQSVKKRIEKDPAVIVVGRIVVMLNDNCNSSQIIILISYCFQFKEPEILSMFQDCFLLCCSSKSSCQKKRKRMAL